MSPDTFTHQSPFLSLPGEIRNRIYSFALRASASAAPITDAVARSAALPPSPHHHVPDLGVGLLRTCRLIHAEAPIAHLYATNTFRFTSVSHCRGFLRGLPDWLRARVADLELDVRDAAPRSPDGVNREWAQYLAWSTGVWAEKLGSLRVDAPGLRVLRLNFEQWPRIDVSRRHLWDILRRLLCNVEGLERVVLRGSFAKGTAMERREPWDPVYYVGTDDVPTDDIVEQMWGMVAGGDDKIIRWEREAGRVALEIVSLEHLRKTNHASIELVHRTKTTDVWPASGACTLDDYKQRKDPLYFASSSRRLNPIAFL
ncbi:uncharacterized protein K452DRAFT_108686 [Aplosporella prunicola CBS 121167]|uniref:Uncharacterized protein n=1 Tax=Aplosporella prunicola CBS 121167 TaxID=1176127 RepID=A0A6A6BS44_9PEZI|nr:uncharacterized protein K452DRAFT_108686 [Aplosporella prunicola CBS 121167]KAF2146293.1 hypothetical protein K452DRAFT_108686 [Aplosporella prunicola CBS 121167]